MTPEELFDELSQRDYSGDAADQYAQDLITINEQVSNSGERTAFLDLLQRAHAEGKRIDVADQESADYIGLQHLIMVPA